MTAGDITEQTCRQYLAETLFPKKVAALEGDNHNPSK